MTEGTSWLSSHLLKQELNTAVNQVCDMLKMELQPELTLISSTAQPIHPECYGNRDAICIIALFGLVQFCK